MSYFYVLFIHDFFENQIFSSTHFSALYQIRLMDKIRSRNLRFKMISWIDSEKSKNIVHQKIVRKVNILILFLLGKLFANKEKIIHTKSRCFSLLFFPMSDLQIFLPFHREEREIISYSCYSVTDSTMHPRKHPHITTINALVPNHQLVLISYWISYWKEFLQSVCKVVQGLQFSTAHFKGLRSTYYIICNCSF